MAEFLCLKMRLRKNFCTKRGSLGQFLIRIRIRDSDPDPNPGFDSGFESGFGSEFESGSGFKTNCRTDPDRKPDPKLLLRIRNTGCGFTSGSLWEGGSGSVWEWNFGSDANPLQSERWEPDPHQIKSLVPDTLQIKKWDPDPHLHQQWYLILNLFNWKGVQMQRKCSCSPISVADPVCLSWILNFTYLSFFLELGANSDRPAASATVWRWTTSVNSSHTNCYGSWEGNETC
jgi:hypothetical protein